MKSPTFHLVEVVDGGAAGVEKFPPQQLPDERDRRLRVLALLEDALKSPVERPSC